MITNRCDDSCIHELNVGIKQHLLIKHYVQFGYANEAIKIITRSNTKSNRLFASMMSDYITKVVN